MPIRCGTAPSRRRTAQLVGAWCRHLHPLQLAPFQLWVWRHQSAVGIVSTLLPDIIVRVLRDAKPSRPHTRSVLGRGQQARPDQSRQSGRSSGTSIGGAQALTALRRSASQRRRRSTYRWVSLVPPRFSASHRACRFRQGDGRGHRQGGAASRFFLRPLNRTHFRSGDHHSGDIPAEDRIIHQHPQIISHEADVVSSFDCRGARRLGMVA